MTARGRTTSTREARNYFRSRRTATVGGSAPIHMKSIFILMLFIIFSVAGIAQNDDSDVRALSSCFQLNEAAIANVTGGRLNEARTLALTTKISGDERAQSECTGFVLGNIARAASVIGHAVEAESLAEQSVHILEKLFLPNDWQLLRPIQILAAVRLESGKTAKAREAVERLQAIRIERPEDSAIVHATVGALLQIEGRLTEAEREYTAALHASEAAGRGESGDTASILHCLASLLLAEHRLDEAGQMLDRSIATYRRAKDSLPIDQIKLLDLRGVLHARLGKWDQAEEDLRGALLMADRQPFIDPAVLRWILTNYSYVLRKNHHRREARSVEARRASLPPTERTAATVVDLTDLLGEKNGSKKGSLR